LGKCGAEFPNREIRRDPALGSLEQNIFAFFSRFVPSRVVFRPSCLQTFAPCAVGCYPLKRPMKNFFSVAGNAAGAASAKNLP